MPVLRFEPPSHCPHPPISGSRPSSPGPWPVGPSGPSPRRCRTRVPAALQPRLQPDRTGLRQTQGTAPQGSQAHPRRPLECGRARPRRGSPAARTASRPPDMIQIDRIRLLCRTIPVIGLGLWPTSAGDRRREVARPIKRSSATTAARSIGQRTQEPASGRCRFGSVPAPQPGSRPRRNADCSVAADIMNGRSLPARISRKPRPTYRSIRSRW